MLPVLVSMFGIAAAQMWGGTKVSPTPTPAEEEEAIPAAEVELFASGLPMSVGDVPAGLANITAQGCNGCHGEVHDQWASSSHARAGRSSAFRDAVLRAGQSTACTQCHRPLAAQHATLAAGYIEGDISRPNLVSNPSFSATLMAEGVGCAACHVRDGAVVSSRPSPDAPHPVKVSAELARSEVCSHCHQLTYPGATSSFYDTFGEWKASPHAAAGVQCQDCHMPQVSVATSASRFGRAASHSDSPSLARALTVIVELADAQAQRGIPLEYRVRIQNTGAAHHVPTGNPYKSLSFVIQLRTLEGEVLAASESEVLRRIMSDTAPFETVSDNRIPAGGEHVFGGSVLAAHSVSAGPILFVVGAQADGEPLTVLQDIPLELN